MASAPPLPLIAVGAVNCAAEPNANVSFPDDPSIHAAEATLVFPAASDAVAVKLWILEFVTEPVVV
jgi:hypothetical protein